MKSINNFNKSALIFVIYIFSSTAFSMDISVAKEVCNQYAEEENVPKNERYFYIKDCVESLQEEAETQIEEPDDKPD